MGRLRPAMRNHLVYERKTRKVERRPLIVESAKTGGSLIY